uniref:Uncharacterized protein n=1 Tax=Rhodococcus sp. Mel TaxID=1093626 RepID=H8ZKX3_9NOCA|nr:hypothetical protein [Rhodococcus sp. Mel]
MNAGVSMLPCGPMTPNATARSHATSPCSVALTGRADRTNLRWTRGILLQVLDQMRIPTRKSAAGSACGRRLLSEPTLGVS